MQSFFLCLYRLNFKVQGKYFTIISHMRLPFLSIEGFNTFLVTIVCDHRAIAAISFQNIWGVAHYLI